MKVCLDIQAAVAQRAGVGRYTRELARHLFALREQDEIRLFCFDFSGRAGALKDFQAPVTRCRFLPGRAAVAAWRILGWPSFDLIAGPADLYHFPNFIIPPLRAGRSVVTIHDVSFMRHPECAEEANLERLSSSMSYTVKRADAIITDSLFSAQEIATLLRFEQERIHPIPLGVDRHFAPMSAAQWGRIAKKYGLDRPYLLTVGTIEPRKNIPFIIEVFEALSDFDGLLVIGGRPGWKFGPILARMKRSRRSSSIRWLNAVSDEDLPGLYCGASVFVTASLYEGFGLPPLEAMSCGVPVISSSGGALAETIGNGGVVMNGFNVDQWVFEIRKLLQDSTHRREVVARGAARAQTFSWEETARRTWRVYRKVSS